jgi:ABC-2 type transport system ATP-binding protein
LVETGSLARLRHLSAVSVDAVVRRAVEGLDQMPGVSQLRVEEDGRLLSCQLSGPVDVFLSALCSAGVERLLIREPSLEELFLAHYGESEVQINTSRPG